MCSIDQCREAALPGPPGPPGEKVRNIKMDISTIVLGPFHMHSPIVIGQTCSSNFVDLFSDSRSLSDRVYFRFYDFFLLPYWVV